MKTSDACSWLEDNVQSPEIDTEASAQIKQNLVAFRKLNYFQQGIVCYLSNMKIEQEELS